MIDPKNPGMKIAERLFERYVRLRKLTEQPDIDPKIKKEIMDFLEILDEYLEFVGTYARKSYEELELLKKNILGF